MAKLHLRLRPRQGLRPVERAAIMMLVDEIQKLGPGRRDDGPEGDPRDLAGRNRHRVPQRENRVENGPDGVRKRPAIRDRRGRANCAAPTQKACPVGLVLRIGDALAFHDGEMGGPYLRLLARAPAARRDERAEFGEILGFDEHLGESRMRVVGGRRGQDHFGVGCELDLAGRRPLLVSDTRRTSPSSSPETRTSMVVVSGRRGG